MFFHVANKNKNAIKLFLANCWENKFSIISHLMEKEKNEKSSNVCGASVKNGNGL